MKIKPLIAGMLLLALAVIILLRFLRPAGPATVGGPTHDSNLPLRVSAKARQPARLFPAAESGTSDSSATNLITRVLHGDVPKLTAEQIAPYLEQNHRNAESLLAAFRATDDRAYLREAMEKFPNDPRVDLMAFYRGMLQTNNIFREPASEERRKWLDAFRQSDPDNALAGLLTARDDFKAGRGEVALQEFLTAMEKPNMQDYLRDSMQSTEEAYRLAGYSEVEAKAFAMDGLRLSHWSELQRLGGNLIELGLSDRKAGDETSAQNAFQLATQLAARLDQPQPLTLIQSYAGLIIQRDILQSLDPNHEYTPYGPAPPAVQSQLDALNQRLSTLGGRTKQVQQLMPTVPDADLLNYMQRMELFGVEAAQRWLLNKYPPLPAGP